MAIQSRVALPLRSSEHALSIVQSPRAAAVNNNRRERLPYMTLQESDVEFNGPPAKRRKFEIVRHRQTTLDAFTIPRPQLPTRPSRVDITQPNGLQPQPETTPPRMPPGVAVVDDAASSGPIRSTVLTNKVKDRGASDQSQEGSGKKKEDRRTLRSQDDGPRLKSELAIYFPDYEDIMLDAPREPDFITIDTALYITDSVPKTSKEQTSPIRSPKPIRRPSVSVNAILNSPLSSLQGRGTSSAQPFSDSPQSSLDMIARTLPEQLDDPLTDEYYFKAHRRAERKEKQLRNIERERAMHEKVQLERILDGLLGHDWLKVLGITGITDGESKKYESKRDYFVKEVQILVNKFKQWKEQEKKQRLEKEEAAALAAARKADSEDGGTDDDEEDDESVGPPSSDLNASAARQLQQEAANAAKASPKLKLPPGKGKAMTDGTHSVYVLPPPEIPIVSFYEKRHLRDAALGKARHGRNVTAFGHPIPEMDEREFCLPNEYVTEDALRSNARQRRRRKRESIAGTS